MLDRLFLNNPVSGGPYWIGLLSSTSSDYGYSIAVDNNKNVYLCGYFSNGSAGNDIAIAKYNSLGVIQWQRRLGGSGQDYGRSISVDSSGNTYICATTGSIGTTSKILIAKYDTDGIIQWQRTFSNNGNDNSRSIAVDSYGNAYVCGDVSNTSVHIAKYDTSGSIQWKRQITTYDNADIYASSIAVDSSDNVYVYTYSNTDTGVISSFIAKYNTYGVLQWQVKVGEGSYAFYGWGITLDSNNNVYICASSSAFGTNDFYIVKLDSSGTLQWQRRFGGSNNDVPQSIKADSSGNVYIIGYSNQGGTNDFQIVKYDTSGSLQWQRTLRGSSGIDYGRGVTVDNDGNFYVIGESNLAGTYDFLFAKLPGDGSLTGTYSVGVYTVIYAASSLTSATPTLTSSTSTLTSAASSFTDASASLTDAATTLTSTVTTL